MADGAGVVAFAVSRPVTGNSGSAPTTPPAFPHPPPIFPAPASRSDITSTMRVLAIVALAAGAAAAGERDTFTRWVVQHGKVYRSREEFKLRR